MWFWSLLLARQQLNLNIYACVYSCSLMFAARWVYIYIYMYRYVYIYLYILDVVRFKHQIAPLCTITHVQNCDLMVATWTYSLLGYHRVSSITLVVSDPDIPTSSVLTVQCLWLAQNRCLVAWLVGLGDPKPLTRGWYQWYPTTLVAKKVPWSVACHHHMPGQNLAMISH